MKMRQKYRHRCPPNGCVASNLMLCIMPRPCVFQDKCPHAHSESELIEWKQRLNFDDHFLNKTDCLTNGTLEDYRNQIFKRLNESEDPTLTRLILTELIGDFTILCDENLYTMHIERGKELTWMFTVKNANKYSGRILERVFFLNECKEFNLEFVVIKKKTHVCRHTGHTNMWANKNKEQQDIGILVKFQAEKYGNYSQELIFDFGGFPKVIKKLGVQVSSEEMLSKTMKYDPQKNEDNELSWLKNYEIKKFDGSTLQGLNIEYALPPNIGDLVMFGAFKHLDVKLTRANYRERHHTLLYVEEYQRRANLQSMTFQVVDFLYCVDKEHSSEENGYIAQIKIADHVSAELTKFVGRSGKALMRITEYATVKCVVSTPVVYEVIVQKIENSALVLQLSKELYEIVTKSVIPVNVDICFCLVDIFQPLHKAVEKVNLDLIFPTFTSKGNLPYLQKKSTDLKSLSSDQYHAVDVIVSTEESAPVLLLGPFGAGKSHTIAECIEKLLKTNKTDTEHKQKHKILICTYSNSAADHYIEEYFHPKHLKGDEKADLNPLRINWEHRYTATVSDKVLAYCLQDLETGLFGIPTKDDLDKHSIIICTLMTSELLSNLQLPPDYFTHIFIDEAAQAMEVKALVPLLLATPNTRIVLAGDHFQMGECLSSAVAKNLGLEKSLLERLFEYYPFDVDCKLKLLENFRSVEEIVKLSSSLFYEDSLLCNKKREEGSKFPVEFRGVKGNEILSKENPSYENTSEAVEILVYIRDLNTQNRFDRSFCLSSICVVAFYPAQVRNIRAMLRKNQLSEVRVQSVNDIQGLEFDTLIISTVRTHSQATLKDHVSRKDMGFLTNPKLLNTAITRARVKVVFVGDPNALCSIGECKPCWKFIARLCETNESFHHHQTFEDLLQLYRKDDKSKSNEVLAEELIVVRLLNPTIKKATRSSPKNEKETQPQGQQHQQKYEALLQQQQHQQKQQQQQQYQQKQQQQRQQQQRQQQQQQQQRQQQQRQQQQQPRLQQHCQHEHNQQKQHQQRQSPIISIGNLYQGNSMQFFGPTSFSMYTPQGFSYPPSFVPNNFNKVSPSCKMSSLELILPAAENAEHLKQKITYIKDYCMEILMYIGAQNGSVNYIRKSMMGALQDLEGIENSKEDSKWMRKIHREIELKVESSYIFVRDQLNQHKMLKCNEMTKISRKALATYEINKKERNILVPKVTSHGIIAPSFSVIDRDVGNCDNDIEDWFTTRRNDPYVQEYRSSYNRRFAQRLSSSIP